MTGGERGSRPRWRRVLRRALVLLVALHVLVPLGVALVVAFPNPFKAFRDPGGPASVGLVAEDLPFAGPDGAWLVRADEPRGVVVLCHGRSRQKEHVLPLARALAADFDVILFDFRAHGARGFGTTTIGWREADDVVAALDAAAALDRGPVAVVGISMGGAAAIRALAGTPRPEVRALVTIGTFAELGETLRWNVRPWLPGYLADAGLALAGWFAGYDVAAVRPVDDVPAVAVPALFLQGDDDELVPPGANERLAAAAEGDRAAAAAYVGGHDEPANPQVQAAVVRFLRDRLPPAGLAADRPGR